MDRSEFLESLAKTPLQRMALRDSLGEASAKDEGILDGDRSAWRDALTALTSKVHARFATLKLEESIKSKECLKAGRRGNRKWLAYQADRVVERQNMSVILRRIEARITHLKSLTADNLHIAYEASKALGLLAWAASLVPEDSGDWHEAYSDWRELVGLSKEVSHV